MPLRAATGSSPSAEPELVRVAADRGRGRGGHLAPPEGPAQTLEGRAARAAALAHRAHAGPDNSTPLRGPDGQLAPASAYLEHRQAGPAPVASSSRSICQSLISGVTKPVS
jgi:hypothetical protein